MSTTIFFGKQGCGKTTRAKYLQQAFGCDSIVDEWTLDQKIKPNALHLATGNQNLVLEATATAPALFWQSLFKDPDSTHCSISTPIKLHNMNGIEAIAIQNYPQELHARAKAMAGAITTGTKLLLGTDTEGLYILFGTSAAQF